MSRALSDPADPARWLAEGALAAVLTAEPLDRLLDYRVPEGGLPVGALVLVPLGPRRVPGVVWGPGQGGLPPERLRTILRGLAEPPFTAELRAFLERAAAYTMTPLPAMLRLATRVPGLGEGPLTQTVYRAADPAATPAAARAPLRLTGARRAVLAALAAREGQPLTLGELASEAGVSPGVVKGLAAQGAVIEERAPRDLPYPRLQPDRPGAAAADGGAGPQERPSAPPPGAEGGITENITEGGPAGIAGEAGAEGIEAAGVDGSGLTKPETAALRGREGGPAGGPVTERPAESRAAEGGPRGGGAAGAGAVPAAGGVAAGRMAESRAADGDHEGSVAADHMAESRAAEGGLRGGGAAGAGTVPAAGSVAADHMAESRAAGGGLQRDGAAGAGAVPDSGGVVPDDAAGHCAADGDPEGGVAAGPGGAQPLALARQPVVSQREAARPQPGGRQHASPQPAGRAAPALPSTLPPAPAAAPPPGLAHLTPAQAAAAARLMRGVASSGYGTTLLHGVTGSGKTEVYLEAVAECLRRGRQALVLLPEIALTAEFLARVEARFGARPAEWHSGITLSERRRLWRMVAQGGAQMVVGARSALFLPFRDLGLVVVDEEHDSSYKQEEGVLYNARDMAVLRGSLAQAQVVLASATPSLESWVNAHRGKYAHLHLPGRYGGAALPQMQAVDLRTDEPGPGRWISGRLAAEVGARLAAGEQSLLFLNRRGYAPVTLCRACGQQIGCPHCDARMVEHRHAGRLMCHQCGHTMPVPAACPACGVAGRLAALGPGVERLAEEVAARWPGARAAVLSSDLYGSARALKAQILAIGGGAADIVIGTQLVAKGHNFPALTLVGVIDADIGLQGSDLRAAEHSFQLMRQVSGRAGRGARPGLALLQTFQPGHPLIRAILAGDEEGFWRAEARERQAAGMPPFGRLAGLILSGPQQGPLLELGRRLAQGDGALRRAGAQVFGPAPAPIARIRDRFRVRLLVKAPRAAPLQAALAEWLRPVKPGRGVRLAIDIDPQSFL